jgi:zinc protease
VCRRRAPRLSLGNGVRVVIEENHVAPLVAVQVWVASGAADDPTALAGAAHFYEHLVLRGGQRRGPGGGAREIEAVKGTVGAWTGLDETVYHTLVAAPFFELGLEVLADAIASPTFDSGEVERVRKLALDEIAAASAIPGSARTRRCSPPRSPEIATRGLCWGRPRRSRR